MTDLHCHILHTIDDGPSSLDESLELCRIAVDNHITKIVATPHLLDFGRAEEFLQKRDERMEELRSELIRGGMEIELYPGAEVFVSDDIFYADCLRRLTINHSRYLLVEFPYFGLGLNSLVKYIEEIREQGLTPIIAHPERYEYIKRNHEMAFVLAEAGALFQVNADSLCAGGGKRELKLIWEMLRQNTVSFFATDAHSPAGRPNNLLEMICAFPPGIDFALLDALVNHNPELVLQDRTLEPPGRFDGMEW